MALLHIDFDSIVDQHLKGLIQAKASESRDIEYKRDMYGGSDADVAECLADISSFANTAGGDLVIGMAASKGIPQTLVPLSGDADASALRIEEIARSGLQPRIPNLRCKSIPVEGGHVILIRVPRSYNPPHRVVRQGKGQFRFWARASNGKYEPNVDELRALFTSAPQLAERIRDFRFERIAKVLGGQSPVQLLGGACLNQASLS